MPRAPLAAPWCSLLLCAAPLGAFPLAPACDTSRLEGWSVNADGGDGLVFRIDPAGEPGGRPHLALEFVRGARGWGNLAAAVAVLGQSAQGLPASQVAAQIQLTFLFLWSIFVIVIGASNRQDLIDPAVLRPGRFDVKIRIDRPNQDAAREIFAKYLTPDLPVAEAELAAHGQDAEATAAALILATAVVSGLAVFLSSFTASIVIDTSASLDNTPFMFRTLYRKVSEPEKLANVV